MNTLSGDDIRALLDEGDMARHLLAIASAALAECDRRRRIVLAQPDLAARLCQPPMGYSRPEVWNGFIPPEVANGVPNRSPARAVLLALLAEAEQRVQGSYRAAS